MSSGYLYDSLEECEAASAHLTDCDADGYCNHCGEQETSESIAQDMREASARFAQDDIARKMDKLLLCCEAARADGWVIAPTGETIGFEENCCCPLGALAIAAGLDNADTALSELTIKILGVSNEWGYDFMRGFDGPIFEEAAGKPNDAIAYNYGKAFRTLYVMRETA